VCGGCEPAGGVHQPLPRLVLRELPIDFREKLRILPARARGCCGFGSAVRHSAALPIVGLAGPVGAAQQQLRDGVGFASERGIVQRRVPARQTGGGDSAAALNGRFAAAETAHPSLSSWAFTSAPDATSNRTIRRLP
jgi:hypothetical protein